MKIVPTFAKTVYINANSNQWRLIQEQNSQTKALAKRNFWTRRIPRSITFSLL